MRFAVKKYVIEEEYPLSKEAAWKLLSDTDRLNIYIGLFPVTFSKAKYDKNGMFFREAHAKVAGIVPISWQEYPFQWKENSSYVVERRYLTGPLKHFIGGVELLESEDSSYGKTKVRLFAEFTPRSLLGIAAIMLTGYKAMKNTMTYLEEYLKIGGMDLSKTPQKPLNHKVNMKELRQLEDSLRKWPVDGKNVDFLIQYLVEKNTQDVANMQPVPIARQWKVEPDEVLRLFLYATKVGILNLSWNLICPNCRVSKVDYTSLSQLHQQFHCDLCGINYDANFDQYVELNFLVHPSIRQAHDQVYCIGGPTITPHVKIQKVIEMGKSAAFTIPLHEDSLRIRVLRANGIVSINDDRSKEEVSIVYTDKGWSQSHISSHTEAIISNSSSSDIVVVLEQASWNNETVTAAKVTAMQEFRDLFSSEVLSPGLKIGIDHVTILFTDLQGSTSLYETVGDANAYGQVRKHFEFLTHWISKNSGSVVKTIGDAVMAVFHLPEDGLRAALQIQKNVSEFNKHANDDIVLKIGIYSGPAIVVNSNDRLDYFGRTVNIAARIQGQGIGDDIVISQHYMEQDKLSKLLSRKDIELQPFKAILKGIEGDMDLIRLTINKC
jgi:adenylate cyclase